MSAFLLFRNVLMGPPKGGPIGEDGDERARVGAGGGVGPSGERRVAFGGRGSADGAELPADGAGVEAVSRARCEGAEAPQRGAAVEPSVRGEVPTPGVGAGEGEIPWSGGGTFRPDISSGAFGIGRRGRGRCRNLASLDAGRRVMEPGAAEAAASAKAGSEGALWGEGADGRELPPLAGGAGPGRVLDGPGRRCDEHHAGALGPGGDDLGGGGRLASLGR